MAGFGIDTSVASAEEVKTAILNQGKDKAAEVVEEAKEEVKLWFTEAETYDYEDLNEKYTRGNF